MTSNTTKNSTDVWKELASRTQTPQAGESVRRMVSRMNEIRPFTNASGVLDNGCGSGVIMAYILDTYGSEIPEEAALLAGDFSESMLDNLRKTKQSKIQTTGDAWDRLELRKMDAHDLVSIPDQSMTHVSGGHVYFLLQDSHKAFNETYRVLQDGGVLTMSNGKSAQHIAALHDAIEEVRPGTDLQLIKAPWTSEEGVRRVLQSAGFVDIETSEIQSEVKYETHRNFAEMLLVMPIMKDATADFDQSEKDSLKEALIRRLRLTNAAEPGSMSGTGIIAHGRKFLTV